jgi:hypothetical protein
MLEDHVLVLNERQAARRAASTSSRTLVARHNADLRSRAYVVPFLIHIDTSYSDPSAPSSAAPPPQVQIPLTTLLRSRGGYEQLVEISGIAVLD